MSATKPARGTRDFSAYDAYLRQDIFKKIVKIFEKCGGKPIQTPAIERMETVKNVYGEEFDKLVYKIDQESDGAESLILRYDQTLPLVRYLANNGTASGKLYQIGRVYRRDSVQICKGRYREFYQADFDIVGIHNDLMIQEVEIISTLAEVLNKLIGEDTFSIQINSREVLYDILANFGCNSLDYATVCATLDKLDKYSNNEWEEKIIKELVAKAIDPVHIKQITEFIKIFMAKKSTPTLKLIDGLYEMGYITEQTLDKLSLLFHMLNECGLDKYVLFNPLLARGLSYYTGIIYEANYFDKNIISSSIASGGRYDELIGTLSNKGNVPAIGLSIGIERIVTILESRSTEISIPKPKVYIATVGKDMWREKLKLCLELRAVGVYVEMSYSKNPKMGTQLNYVLENDIPFMIVIGGNEIKKGTVMLKTVATKEQIEMIRSDAINYFM